MTFSFISDALGLPARKGIPAAKYAFEKVYDSVRFSTG
jgi:hypothetical protein